MSRQWVFFTAGLAAGFPLAWAVVRMLAGHRHRWVAVASQIRTAGLPMMRDAITTVVLWRCAKRNCEAVDSTEIEGRWNYRDIDGTSVPTVPDGFRAAPGRSTGYPTGNY